MSIGRVVILGGSGFVGTALARALCARDVAVDIVSRSDQKCFECSGQLRHVRASLEETEKLRPVLSGAQWIVHLACDSVPGSPHGAAAEAMSNLVPTLAFLDELRSFPNVRLLFVSTGGALYGRSVQVPTRESVAATPLSYYAAGKVAVEGFLQAFTHLHGRETIILRPSNLYGPGQPVRPGFGIIPTLLHAAASGSPVEMLGGGKAVRDFLYIDDFVELCLVLMRAPPRLGVRVYNAGSGQPTRISDLHVLVERCTGGKIERVMRPARPADVDYVVLDSWQAEHDLGWRASTALGEGVMRTCEWFNESLR